MISPARKAPIAFLMGAGIMWSAAVEFEAFSVRAMYITIFETICSQSHYKPSRETVTYNLPRTTHTKETFG